MNMTKEQERAALAYQHVSALKEGEKKVYGTLALKLPALLRSSGLCQTVHFIKSRNDKATQAAHTFLGHLGEQLKRVDPEISDMETLCERSRKAQFATYLWLSREALAVATWYARLAKSELKVESGEDP